MVAKHSGCRRAKHGMIPLVLLLWLTNSGHPAEWSWQRTDSSVALVQGESVVWRFHYDRDLDVPYLHPLSTVTGAVLSQDQPADHVWHHGLWFSWKFINGVNYWEINPRTRRPDGRTQWSEPHIETKDDRSAVVSMQLHYRPAADDGQAVLSERRRIEVSASDAQGQYHLDWTSKFTAGARRVVLDRTPPKEQSSGGYAGLSMRFAERFTERRAVSSQGAAEFGEGGRHRSRAPAMDYSGVIDGQTVGLAFLDHPDNPRHPTPWYLIRGPKMSYINAALLTHKPLTLEAGDSITLRYRLIVHPHRWDRGRLRRAHARFARTDHIPSAE